VEPQARTDPAPYPLILRSREPEALEFPFASLDSYLTPNDRFYQLSHFGVPRLDSRTWRLRVEGAVDRPLDLTYDDLLEMKSIPKVAMLECSGNGRVFLLPKVNGVPWELGGVGNAEWTGVPLDAVLERAGVRQGAVEVILEGADHGERKEEPRSPGSIPFARSIPIAKARTDVLLAYRMNGVDLPPAHGYPLRAVVPGWHGVASVKWLTRVVVADRRFVGYFQSLEYTYFERRDGLPSLVPVTEVGVKSQVARPGRGERVPRGTDYRVHGAAWAGESDVVKVEVSTDGGGSWSEAGLLGEPVRHAWRLWEFNWRTPGRSGPRTVMARARDASGRVQPMARDPDRRSYMISHVLPVEVEVV
jgi:DMSO/TMAO reductase YedYZ molybdopterin-dependent catalytic subunit